MTGRRALLLSLVLLLAGAAGTRAAPGDRDDTFGNGGIVLGPGLGTDVGRSVALQADGKILSGGGPTSMRIVRYLPDGSPDPGFGVGGQATPAAPGPVSWIVVRTDGTILAGGGIKVAKLLSDGTPDATFGTAGIASTFDGTKSVTTLAGVEQPDGKIVVAGSTGAPALVRLNGDGTIDTGFGTNGYALLPGLGFFDAVLLQPDGAIVAVGGTFTAMVMARFDASGALDASFGTGGISTFGNPASGTGLTRSHGVVRQPSGKLVVLGPSSVTNAFALIRVDTGGTIDATFGDIAIVTLPLIGSAFAYDLAQDGDGNLVASGTATAGSFVRRFAVARLDADGALDAAFGTTGAVVHGMLTRVDDGALAIQPDGKLVLVGSMAGQMVTMRLLGGTCGNGTTEAGEDCDDGNTVGGDGCDAHCCVADVDGDGVCDSIDPCADATPVTRPQIKESVHGALAVKGLITFVPPAAIDPIANGFRLQVRSAHATLIDVMVPPGQLGTPPSSGWRPNNALPPSQWTYKAVGRGVSSILSEFGITKVVIQNRSAVVPGLVKFAISGVANEDSLADTPLSATVAFDPPAGSGGACADLVFPGPFSPSCVTKPAGNVVCK